MSPIAISQNIIETPTKLKSIVESYLKCPQEDHVKIPVPSRVYQQSEVPNLLSERNLTFCYDIDREALHIKIPSILHESFNRYLGNTFLNACMCQNFFTWEQKSLVFYDRKSVHLPGTLSRKSMLKKEAWDKDPDGLFEIYSEVDNRYHLKIAVEIGFTENIDELRFDMEQWLLKCSSMRAVILVNINEDNRPTMKTLSTLARDIIRPLIDDYGNSNCLR